MIACELAGSSGDLWDERKGYVMLHTNLIKIGLICAIAFAGCGGIENDEDLASQTSESSVKVLDLNLIGTFISDSKRAGDLEQLVLKTNGTFHAATVVECFAPPCNPVQQDGAYAISWRDSRRYITLYNPYTGESNPIAEFAPASVASCVIAAILYGVSMRVFNQHERARAPASPDARDKRRLILPNV